MLSLKPEDEKSLHPEALKWFNARRAEIQFEVPLEELSDDDLNTFLSDDEKREFIRCKDEIAKGLYGCINKDDASPDPLTNASIGLSLLTFEVNSLSPTYTMRLLLKKVYQRHGRIMRKTGNVLKFATFIVTPGTSDFDSFVKGIERAQASELVEP